MNGDRLVAYRLLAGRPVVRVEAPSAPGRLWAPVTPSLEDAYFSLLTGPGAEPAP